MDDTQVEAVIAELGQQQLSDCLRLLGQKGRRKGQKGKRETTLQQL